MIKYIVAIGLMAMVFTTVDSRGQATNTNAVPTPVATNAAVATPTNPPAVTEPKEKERWSFGFSAYTYIVPDDHEYVQPTITLDRGSLHLEGRYNYEALNTASIWGGWNFSGGGEILPWELTPMIGGVFGDLSGVAPGFKASLGFWRLELYTEGEYFVDVNNSDNNFFYSWSELTFSFKRIKFGLVAQRTHLYNTDRDIQRGLLLGVDLKRIYLTGYVLNPDDGDPTWVFAAGVHF